MIDLQSGQARKEKTQVGVGKISVSKFHEYVKVPVSQGTVSKSIKDAQNNPRSTCQQKANEIKTPGFLPDPSKQVEENKAGMKDRKKDIKKSHPTLYSP